MNENEKDIGIPESTEDNNNANENNVIRNDVTETSDASSEQQEAVSAEAETAAETDAPSYNTPNVQPGTPVMQNGRDYTYSWNGSSFVAKKRRSGAKVAAIMVVTTLLISAMAFWAGAIASRRNSGYDPDPSLDTDLPAMTDSLPDEESREYSKAPQVITSSSIDSNDSEELSELYRKCSQSCATIYVKVRGGYSIGSGFVVSKDGYMITNHHVVENGTEISVIFYDGTKYTAEVVGSDSLSDIAVLRINAENLVPIELGNSSALKVGDGVFAIGTPYSMELAGTMTTGVISGVDRKVNVTNDYGTVTKTMTLIQTDSAINPGNSGGPLINMKGQVIGINSLKLSNYDGIGFAIPISSAIDIANELIEYGEVRDYNGELVTATPKLNITISSVSDAREQYVIPDDAPEGCIVLAVTRNSSVYRAGLELYDIITEFNGTRVENKDQLSEALNKCRAGQTVTMKLYRINRDGTGRELEIRFALDSVQ